MTNNREHLEHHLTRLAHMTRAEGPDYEGIARRSVERAVGGPTCDAPLTEGGACGCPAFDGPS